MLQAVVWYAASCPACPWLGASLEHVHCAGSCSDDVKMLSVSCSCSGRAAVMAVSSAQSGHL